MFQVSGGSKCSGMNRLRDRALNLERVMGIEPTLAAWEAAVLPLNYTRGKCPRRLLRAVPTVRRGDRCIK